jgi:tetratricopeptide (TPR) repeat protein
VRGLTAILVALLLATLCFTIATVLEPMALRRHPAGPDSVLKVLLGDGRRIFANHFFTKADVYFHSGYYPSVFDRAAAPRDSRHLRESESDHDHHDEAEEKAEDFLGTPRDILERFGRNFMVTRHTHLENGKEREILPWLKLSAELDPQQIDTYTVSAYWLRKLGKTREAEDFLRDGLRANPGSYEILFELGGLYNEQNDPARARNIWELALRRWKEKEAGKTEPDKITLNEIAVNLAILEEKAGNIGASIHYLEIAKTVSPHPDEIQRQIQDLRLRSGK